MRRVRGTAGSEVALVASIAAKIPQNHAFLVHSMLLIVV